MKKNPCLTRKYGYEILVLRPCYWFYYWRENLNHQPFDLHFVQTYLHRSKLNVYGQCYQSGRWLTWHGKLCASIHRQLRRNWRVKSTTCLRLAGQIQLRQHVRHSLNCCHGYRSNQFPREVVLASHGWHMIVNSWILHHQQFEDLFW